MTSPRYITVDLEATSGEPKDAHVVEWAAVVGGPAFTLYSFETRTCYGALVKPPIAIPPETSAVHHIIDEDVAECSTWAYEGACLRELFVKHPGSIAIAHNANYERTVLASLNLPCEWICTYKAALRVWPDAPSHSNEGLRYWLKLGGGRKAYNRPHSALHDAIVTSELFNALLLAGTSLEDMIAWANEPALLPRCPLGDWRGKPWAEVDDGFLHWILRKIFDRDDVRFCAQRELDRREAEWRAQQREQEQEEAHQEDDRRTGALF